MQLQTFDQLLKQHASTILKVALANVNELEDAKDITQDVCVKFYKYYQKNYFKDEQHVLYWLIRVTINQCNSFHRLLVPKHHEYLDGVLQKDEVFSTTIKQELSCLSSKERTLVYLHYIEGYTYKEIGQMTNRNEHTIASKIRRSLKKIKITMEENL